VSLRITLLSVNKVRELCWVSQEEDGCVVGDPIKVSFGSLELYGETTRVTRRVRGTGFTTDSGESHGDGAFGTFFEHGGQAEVVHVFGADEFAVCTGTLGCRDALARWVE
jgi:hypothetical protein